MSEETQSDEPSFSAAAKGELARLSAEAKNLVLHTIHSAATLAVEGAAVVLTRAHVLAVGERFGPLFDAPAPAVEVPCSSEQAAALTQQIDALKSQLAKAATDLDLANGQAASFKSQVDALTAQVATLNDQIAALTPAPVKDPLAPPEKAAEASQPAESNVPTPDAAPAA